MQIKQNINKILSLFDFKCLHCAKVWKITEYLIILFSKIILFAGYPAGYEKRPDIRYNSSILSGGGREGGEEEAAGQGNPGKEAKNPQN